MRFTIASLLILTTLTSCVLVEWCFPPATWVQSTNDPFHVSIHGPGAFQLLDEKTCKTVTSRKGELCVDCDSRVVLTFDDNEYPIEPPLCIPDGSVAVSIGPDGLVQSQSRHGDWRKIGHIQLIKYGDERGLSRPTQINDIDFQLAVLVGAPQAPGFGRLEQGSIEKLRIFSFHRILGCVTLCLSSLLTWKSNSIRFHHY